MTDHYRIALQHMTEFLTLNSPGCTAIWELPPGEAPLWRYWGPRLPDAVLPPTALRATRTAPGFSLAFDQPLSIFPGVGMGWFGQSAILAHRSGRDWTSAITGCVVEQVDASHIRFHLTDAVTMVDVSIDARLDPATDVLTLQTGLTNRGEAALDVQWLASGTVPLPANAHVVRSYGGRYNAEFVAIDDRLTRSAWRRENRRGLTSHDSFPGAVVSCADGSAYGAQLAWSGNHVQQIEAGDDGRRTWQMGEWLAPGEVRLMPGATLTSPELLATCSADGVDGVAHNFHRAVRGRMTWPGGAMAPRPVHLNTWEGFYFRHDEAALIELAETAAAIGVERFVLDDGWFHGRHNDTSSLGDWWVDAGKYPHGLKPLADHVTGLGMEFGLWIEPEMVSPDSDLFRAHPDWVLSVPARPLLTARNQLVLDLTRPEVGDYLFEHIAALLSALPISYLKWDHNRDLSHAGATALYRQQVLAAYALFARFRSAFPDVEIEACAGGGGRIDAGIVQHTHRFWASDCIDAVARVGIQHGFLQFMPPELMGSHVGTSPAHSTGRAQAMAFRCAVALPGAFGVELDVRRLSDADRADLCKGINRYKRLRNILHGGQVWRGDVSDGLTWQAQGTAADFVLMLIRTGPTTLPHAPLVPLSMLDPARRYRVEPDGDPDSATDIDGAWLGAVGLPAPPMRAEQVAVYRVTAL